MNDLNLALIGNCTIGALVDEQANIVWCCFPRFDGDPTFCALVQPAPTKGYFALELADFYKAEQHYLKNTAILVTRLHDQDGGCIEVVDFAPRFGQYGRMFRPVMLVRRVQRISGNPRLTIRLRPSCDQGAGDPSLTWGSHHIRYVMPKLTLRLTTNASVTAILEETTFFLEDSITLILGPDETVPEGACEIGRRFLEETTQYWHEWVRFLSIPFEWQAEVIRAAITLKLNAFDDTGAIIAAITTSIPEAPDSGRNWDYRYCWLRDGYFVVNALNRMGATRTMERYLAYITNIIAAAEGKPLQPVYGIDGRAFLEESEMPALAGYRGMGPVRQGNQAYRQIQHDVYGSAVLAATHMFFDQRLTRIGDKGLFHRLEPLGELAIRCYDQPDAGLWELRGNTRVHTFSAVMCWAACDRLARIAERLGLEKHTAYWQEKASTLRHNINQRAWNEERNAFVSTFGGDTMDASLLLLTEIGFLAPSDPRFVGTVTAIEQDLRRGDFIFRYVEKDDFGEPENAFLVCTFWYINALAALGRREEARGLFEKLLGYRNRHGLYAEHLNPKSHEHWGNFVQTYSMVGLINSALRLSIRWDQAF